MGFLGMRSKMNSWPTLLAVSFACTQLSSTAGAWTCVTEKHATCEGDVCRFSSAEDEPLHFSFSTKGKSVEVGFGEGSQSGRLTLVETPDALAVVTQLGPVRMGGKIIADRKKELFVGQIDRKTKAFFVRRSCELLTGGCN